MAYYGEMQARPAAADSRIANPSPVADDPAMPARPTTSKVRRP